MTNLSNDDTALLSRREFERGVLGTAAALAAGSPGPAVNSAAGEESAGELAGAVPPVVCGVAAGDVTTTRAILWSRSDRPARMIVELARTPEFIDARRIEGPRTSPDRDCTAKLELQDLTPGSQWHYRVHFQDLEDSQLVSEPVAGEFRTAPADRASVRFLWSADTAGQGFGIDPARGGMTMYRTMLQRLPDFFLHCGDNIYADNPIPESIPLEDGSLWRNLTTPETSKVAESLAEFHGRYRYNWLDEHFRRFHAQVPIIPLWDDHEVLNNWYPGETLEQDDRYEVKSATLLAERARQAFFNYLPIREEGSHPGRIERVIHYGPHLDIFCLDLRSYRGPNNGRAPDGREDGRLLGRDQLEWLKDALAASRATWKVFASDMPIGLIVGDGPDGVDAIANGDGPPRGREGEIAELLSFLKRTGISNTLWLTGDVHYASSLHYDPARAVFLEFEPFWEFTSGPIHAGTFGPNRLDNTFGPEVRFQSIPQNLVANRPPSDGLQFFGEVEIDGATGRLTVTHRRVTGDELWSVTLTPTL